MTVLSVNGVPAAEAMDRWMKRQRKYVGYSSERYLRYDAARFFHRQMKRGATVTLELEDVDGRTLGVKLKAEGRGWYIPRLPVPRQGIEDGGADVQWVRLKDGIGYIHVRRIRQGLEVSLDQALTALGDVKGLILDVRGNSGGGFNATTAFRNFDLAPGDGAAPHRPLYKGPIAMLIDERCISAGEGWASWFVARKRARLFGTTTAGASARKETYTLRNGLYKVRDPREGVHRLPRPADRAPRPGAGRRGEVHRQGHLPRQGHGGRGRRRVAATNGPGMTFPTLRAIQTGRGFSSRRRAAVHGSREAGKVSTMCPVPAKV